MGVGASQCYLKIICDIAITLLYLQGNWPKERQPKEFEMQSAAECRFLRALKCIHSQAESRDFPQLR